ncbi:MFS transporter [Plantactinospora endophytica]|uniref:MFS transporter n=1 Tax=Plantactinospora endophytica TaxID=673535 RepID=A0ABQ4DS44_9ACTN|nr:MFS transporter [Plantactinospora endophytica]
MPVRAGCDLSLVTETLVVPGGVAQAGRVSTTTGPAERRTGTPDPADRPATFGSVLAVPEFRALFGGFGVFMVGETVKMLALAVLVYDRTGSPLLAALAYVVGFLPHAIGGVLLLALADRWRPRALMVGYDLLRLAAVAVLALGVLPPAGMLGLVFAVGLLAPVSTAARNALLPELLDGDGYVLGRSLFTVAAGATQVLGFAVGGLLLALVGPYGALWLTVLTCAVSALLVRFGVAERPHRAVNRRGVVRQTWQVNRELLGDRRIRGLLLAHWLPGSLLVGAEGVIVPYTDGLGPGAGAGVLFAASAGGMLVGDLVVGRWVAPARRERLAPWLALLLGAPMLGFVAGPGLAVAAALYALATFGFAFQLGLARRFLAAVPEQRRGQAFGLLATGLMTAQGLAAGLAGVLAEWLAPGRVMALAGVASMAATLLLWRWLRPDNADPTTALPSPPATVPTSTPTTVPPATPTTLPTSTSTAAPVPASTPATASGAATESAKIDDTDITP